MECDKCSLEWRWCAWLEWCYACLTWRLLTGFPVALSWVHLFCSVRNETLQSPNPREWEREYRPCVNLHREKWFQLLQNCVKLKSVSCTSNLLTCDFRKCTKILLMLILSLQGLLQNQSLETILVCIVVPYFHITILRVFTCMMNVRDQTRQAFLSRFCPFCDRTIKFVHRPQISGLPTRAKYRHFSTIWSKLLTILLLTHFLLL